MVLPPLNGHFQGYDHKRLGELTAGIILMAYGYEDRAVPSPTAPWDKVDEAIRLELGVVPKTKLVLGVPGYGTLYSGIQDGPTLLYGPTLLSLPAARDRVFSAGVKSGYSPEAASESARWQDDKNETFEAFLESNRSLQARVSLAKRYGLRGVAIWHLGLLNQGWWDAVLQTVEPKR
jgi:spore germination protein YaaH